MPAPLTESPEAIVEDYQEIIKKCAVEVNGVKVKAKKFVTEFKEELKQAKDRETRIKAIDNTTFFIKLKQGVSDLFKSKFKPYNKQTTEIVTAALAEAATRSGDFGSFLVSATHLSSKPVTKYAEIFKMVYNNICGWDAFESKARRDFAASEKKETEVFIKVAAYLKEKDTAKALGGDDYKKFKAFHEAIAKSL